MNTACVATVTDDRFITGTAVMLHSFVEHHPDFDGDLVVMHDELSKDSRAALAHLPNVRLHRVGEELRARVRDVVEAMPSMSAKAAIFFSLEAFNLKDYARVVKIDSDVLCVGNADALFETNAALLAAPDRFYFKDMRRDAQTYLPVAREYAAADSFDVTFNPGVMSIAPGALPGATHRDLLALVHPSTWRSVRTGHTDSVVLNRHFRGAWTQLHERYNYFVWKDRSGYTRPRAPMRDAVLLHFLPRPKPWEPQTREGLEPDHARALDMWDAAAARMRNPPGA